MVNNNILAFFCRCSKFLFTTVYTKVCILKAIIVPYAFLVQYFENTTTVAYAGLRVKNMYSRCQIGPGLSCQHNCEHNRLLKASNITPA